MTAEQKQRMLALLNALREVVNKDQSTLSYDFEIDSRRLIEEIYAHLGKNDYGDES